MSIDKCYVFLHGQPRVFSYCENVENEGEREGNDKRTTEERRRTLKLISMIQLCMDMSTLKDGILQFIKNTVIELAKLHWSSRLRPQQLQQPSMLSVLSEEKRSDERTSLFYLSLFSRFIPLLVCPVCHWLCRQHLSSRIPQLLLACLSSKQLPLSHFHVLSERWQYE